MRQLESINRYVTDVECTVGFRIDHQEETLRTVDGQCVALTVSHNELTDSVNQLLKQVADLRYDWDTWNEWTPIDQHQEEEQPIDEVE